MNAILQTLLEAVQCCSLMTWGSLAQIGAILHLELVANYFALPTSVLVLKQHPISCRLEWYAFIDQDDDIMLDASSVFGYLPSDSRCFVEFPHAQTVKMGLQPS